MKQTKIDEIKKVRDGFLNAYPRWRKGQALFNAIYYVDPEIANKIRGSDIDPFHIDDNIEPCMKFLEEQE